MGTNQAGGTVAFRIKTNRVSVPEMPSKLSCLIAPPGAFRLILALVVFVNHTLPIQLGSCAVYIFFMLSGYWVHEMWFREYRFTNRPVLVFFVSRLWRLLPMYYVVLLILVSVRSIGGQHPFPWQHSLTVQALHFYFSHALLFFYAMLDPELRTFLPVWSLDIEMQFYAVAPLLFICMSAGADRCRTMLVTLVSSVGLLVFLGFYEGLRAQAGFLPMYLLFFMVGVRTAQRKWRPSEATALSGSAIAGFCVVVCLALASLRPLLIQGSFSGWLSIYNPAANVVLALLMAPYAMATVHQSGVLPRSLDRHLSNLTYDIYLLHWPAAVALLQFAGDLSTYQRLPLVILAWIAVPCASVALYILLDRPIDRQRARFVRRQMAKFTASTADNAFVLTSRSTRVLPS